MSLFTFRKWYWDVLTVRQEFVMVYLVRIRFGRTTQTNVNVVVVFGDGTAASASQKVPEQSIQEGNDGWSIQAENGRLTFGPTETVMDIVIGDIRLSTVHRPRCAVNSLDPLTIAHGRKWMTWHPSALSSMASGEVILPNRRQDFSSVPAYADFVYSNFFPLKMPARQVLWGRFHSDGIDAAFTRVIGASQRSYWQQFVLQTPDRAYAFSNLEIRTGKEIDCPGLGLRYPRSYHITGKSGQIQFELAVERIRPLVQSDFLNDQEMQSRLVRHFYGWLARRPWGIKFLSRCTLRLELPQHPPTVTTGFLVDEHAEFR